jgi:putative restriction endonuclease
MFVKEGLEMKMYVGVTDWGWFSKLRRTNVEEVNFWKPGGKQSFKALRPGELFLFKLHSPKDYIVGGGIFVKFLFMPISYAWEAFGAANGVENLPELYRRVKKYRETQKGIERDPQIGCILLSKPFFLPEESWIPVPNDWNKSIVQGKTYDATQGEGSILFKNISKELNSQKYKSGYEEEIADGANSFTAEYLTKSRLGQGTFRAVVTEIYKKQCTVTGEKTLPVLQAAHIKPYSEDGPSVIGNGILLREDIHTLFDKGYLTINKDYIVEVSGRIKEDFGNGREYYNKHGKKLLFLPDESSFLPDIKYLEWHNENVYLG